MSLAAIDRLMGPDKIAVARATLARVSLALNARNARGLRLPPMILLTDDQRDADYIEAVRALPSGSAVIVRHRDPTARAKLGQILADIARPLGLRCLIAADLELAERIDADGIHASEADLGLIPQWRARHPRWLITGAAHAPVAIAGATGVNAGLLAPVFPTASHPEAVPLGAEKFAAIAAQASLPLYALGGITAQNVEQLAASNAAGIALIGGWLRS